MDKETFLKDFFASIVVFLVAVPLCLGIAMASGVPPAAGLISGIIGGLVIGSLSGCPLQVSGPAAGLITVVWDIVDKHGMEGMGAVLLAAGVLQLVLGVAGLGKWFRAVSPAVIKGMLSGIGVLIFASQFHVMVDDAPKSSALANLLTIPQAIFKGVFPLEGTSHHYAASIGLLTIAAIIGWTRWAPKKVKAIPSSLIGVVGATALAQVLDLPIRYVEIPENMADSLSFAGAGTLTMLMSPAVWLSAAGVAFIASAETLLTATAVDAMQDGPRTKYNKEVAAQGVGNVIAGAIGALPITGVIVRSAANVQAGGATRASAIMHGFWLLLFVFLVPGVLVLIPTSSLAAILVFTGIKLMNPASARSVLRHSRAEAAIYFATVIAIVLWGLLTGIMVGFGIALARLLWAFSHIEIRIADKGKHTTVHIAGAAHFVNLPRLAEALEGIPRGREVHMEAVDLLYADHASLEFLKGWFERYRNAGGSVVVELEQLDRRSIVRDAAADTAIEAAKASETSSAK